MKKVYLAYARQDEERAEEVRRILLAQGYRPWMDPQPLGEAEWHIDMEAAIQAADALVLLLTGAAANSLLVTYEWALALGAGKPVFAIIYEAAEEHPRLQTVQRYDPRAFGDENHFWDHFVADCRRRLEGADAEGKETSPATEEAVEIDKSLMPAEPGYWVVMRRGPQLSQMFRLERAVVNIGRDLANDIVIRDAQISRYHLRLMLQGEDFHLEDLGSSNGTRVNGLQVSSPTPLNDGDVIALGDSILLTYDLVYLD